MRFIAVFRLRIFYCCLSSLLAKTTQARFQEVMTFSEGRNASSLLIGAWSAMRARYPSLSPAVSDSAYHHLCALDLF